MASVQVARGTLLDAGIKDSERSIVRASSGDPHGCRVLAHMAAQLSQHRALATTVRWGAAGAIVAAALALAPSAAAAPNQWPISIHKICGGQDFQCGGGLIAALDDGSVAVATNIPDTASPKSAFYGFMAGRTIILRMLPDGRVSTFADNFRTDIGTVNVSDQPSGETVVVHETRNPFDLVVDESGGLVLALGAGTSGGYSVGQSAIAKVTPGGAVTEHEIGSVVPYQVVGGLGGSVFFSRYFPRTTKFDPSAMPATFSQIGEIAANGQVHTDPAPSSDDTHGFGAPPRDFEYRTAGRTTSLTLGPHGRPWISTGFGPRTGVYEVTSSAVLRPIATLAPGTAFDRVPRHLTRATDGAVWFTAGSAEAGGCYVGRITRGLRQRRWTLPTGVCLTTKYGRLLSAGRDGSVWLRAGTLRQPRLLNVDVRGRAFRVDVPLPPGARSAYVTISSEKRGRVWYSMRAYTDLRGRGRAIKDVAFTIGYIKRGQVKPRALARRG